MVQPAPPVRSGGGQLFACSLCVYAYLCAGPYRASEPKVPGGGALVGDGFLGGRQEGIKLFSVESCLVEVGGWL